MVNATYEAQVGLEHPNPAAYLKIIGAVISLIVFLGMIGWGAKMISRDSLGAPVVHALDGPMRISPEDPGGVIVSHQGLTVNEVASSQKKLPLKDRLRLAPRAIKLQAEDQPISSLLASVVLLKASRPLRPTLQGNLDSEIEFPIENVNGDSISKILLPPISPVLKINPEVLTTEKDLFAVSSLVNLPSGLGPKRSPRPRIRSLASSVSLVHKSVTIAPRVTSQSKPMAQLGAFSSKTIAMQEWLNLLQRHGDYLTGKKHIILKAEVGDGTIYRLRVHGFSDLAAARRLCKALNGQNAECYSIMMN